MKKVRGATSDKFHGEFGGGIAGLANSAKISVKRAALRKNIAKMSVAAELSSCDRRSPYRGPKSGKPYS